MGKLTVTQATAVNKVLDWILGGDRYSTKVSAEEARAAAEVLADDANDSLHAGVTPTDVRVRWPAQPPAQARRKK